MKEITVTQDFRYNVILALGIVLFQLYIRPLLFLSTSPIEVYCNVYRRHRAQFFIFLRLSPHREMCYFIFLLGFVYIRRIGVALDRLRLSRVQIMFNCFILFYLRIFAFILFRYRTQDHTNNFSFRCQHPWEPRVSIRYATTLPHTPPMCAMFDCCPHLSVNFSE